MTIQYDGTDFHGWQVQAEGRTVQGDIEAALKQIFPTEKINLLGAGRTDSGVHALAQVAHVELPDRLSPMELCSALNGNLQWDVRINSAIEAKEDFHSRFSAIDREYEYHLVEDYSPITRHYTVKLKWDIDSSLLNDCANKLLGEHDFSSFCKANAEVEHKKCIIYQAAWQFTEKKYIFQIRANRFLQHMVRYLVGTMLEVARGRYEVSDFRALVYGHETDVVVTRAPARGLFLKKVNYQ